MFNSAYKTLYKKVMLFIGGFLLILYILFPSFVSSIAYRVIAPLWVLGDGIISTTSSNEEVEILKRDNEILRKRIGILEASDTNGQESVAGILANVLYRPPRTRYDVITIDKGLFDGVNLNQTAYTTDLFFAGYVSAVWKNRAEVSLWSTPGVDLIYSVGNYIGKGISAGVGTIEIQIPKDVVIESGDVVRLKGMEIGFVSYIEVPVDGIWKDVFVSTLVNPFKVSRVIISSDEI